MPIERYLEQHPDLATTLAELVKEDTLVGSLRASAGQAAADPPELAGLMDKLSRLRSAGREASVDLASGKSIASSNDDTLGGLAPPQAAGEIGRLGGYRVLKCWRRRHGHGLPGRGRPVCNVRSPSR